MSLISKQCVDFVKSFEGFSPTVYLDEVNVPTLGYGMTGKEIEGLNYVTEEQASNMLENLLNNKYAAPIKKDLDSKGTTLTQNQFDALVSMAYNIGVGGLLGSTLYRNICNGVRDIDTITTNFTAWSKAGGQILSGLLRRRKDEAKMFFGTGNQVNNSSSDILIENVKDPTRILQIKSLAYYMNLDYNCKLKYVDGNIYQELLDNLESLGKNLLKKGHKSHVVLWLQQKMEIWGWLKKGNYTPMLLDNATFSAITELQKAWGRETSGLITVKNRTWEIFLNNK